MLKELFVKYNCDYNIINYKTINELNDNEIKSFTIESRGDACGIVVVHNNTNVDFNFGSIENYPIEILLNTKVILSSWNDCSWNGTNFEEKEIVNDIYNILMNKTMSR
jgi:hypothetical protein